MLGRYLLFIHGKKENQMSLNWLLLGNPADNASYPWWQHLPSSFNACEQSRASRGGDFAIARTRFLNNPDGMLLRTRLALLQ
jgi:hypothetical protein